MRAACLAALAHKDKDKDATPAQAQVVRRRLSGGHGDEVVLREDDASRFLALTATKDGAVVTINASSKTSSEVRARFTSCTIDHPKLQLTHLEEETRCEHRCLRRSWLLLPAAWRLLPPRTVSLLR